jgi:hypothetical protein
MPDRQQTSDGTDKLDGHVVNPVPYQSWRTRLATGENPAPNWRRHGGTPYDSGWQLSVRVFGLRLANSQ